MKKLLVVAAVAACCAVSVMSAYAGVISVNNVPSKVAGGAQSLSAQFSLSIQRNVKGCHHYADPGCVGSLGLMRNVNLNQKITSKFYSHQTTYPDNLASVINSGDRLKASGSTMQIGNSKVYRCKVDSINSGGPSANHVNLIYDLVGGNCHVAVSTS